MGDHDVDYQTFDSDDNVAGLPSHQQSDTQLETDLEITASGEGRRNVRRTVRRAEVCRIDADSDKDSDTTSVDEDYEVDSILSSIDERLTWRGRLQRSLHTNVFHIIIVVLVCIDALIVVFELLLDVGAFNNRRCIGDTPVQQQEFCHHSTDGSCRPTAKQILRGRNISESPLNGTGNEGLCDCRYRQGNLVCVFVDEHSGVNPAEILHTFSLIILTVFLIEIILKIVAFRLKYFTHKFEVFDGMVVVVSWVLDVASMIEEEAFEAAALIIVLRLWRVVRIVNGAVLSSKAQSDRQLTEARVEAKKIIHAFHKCQDKVDVLEEEKATLIKAMRASGTRIPANIKTTNTDLLITIH